MAIATAILSVTRCFIICFARARGDVIWRALRMRSGCQRRRARGAAVYDHVAMHFFISIRL